MKQIFNCRSIFIRKRIKQESFNDGCLSNRSSTQENQSDVQGNFSHFGLDRVGSNGSILVKTVTFLLGLKSVQLGGQEGWGWRGWGRSWRWWEKWWKNCFEIQTGNWRWSLCDLWANFTFRRVVFVFLPRICLFPTKCWNSKRFRNGVPLALLKGRSTSKKNCIDNHHHHESID